MESRSGTQIWFVRGLSKDSQAAAEAQALSEAKEKGYVVEEVVDASFLPSSTPDVGEWQISIRYTDRP